MGLALSGGGFRTALFHVGVLTRLAETGVLKHVSVISTVSGGSIVGATFLLHLREQLRAGPVSDEEMVTVVARVARAVSAAAAANVRVRALTIWRKLVKMARPDYSRSDRMSELYQEFCFNELGVGLDGEPISMRDLTGPIGTPAEGCQPLLMINATSLNSGRSWSFSQETMGEPKRRGIAADIDRAMRFKAPERYGELQEHARDVPLGIAVAASAALPGLLHPMSISQMYPKHRVQLTDGGVHDNQGIQALIDRGCTVFFVSDTGGQLLEEEHARPWLLQVLLRSKSIQYGRIRQEQLFRVSGKQLGKSPLALAHLRRGVRVREIGFDPSLGGPPVADSYDRPPTSRSSSFGVDERVMKGLAEIRTDLDAFTEVERAALMSAGYLITADVLRSKEEEWLASDLAADVPNGAHEEMGLPQIGRFLAHPTPDFLHQVEVGHERLWKVFRMPLWTAGLFRYIGAVASVALVVAAVRYRNVDLPLWTIAGPILALVAVLAIQFSTKLSMLLDSRPVVAVLAARNAVLGAFAWMWAHAYLLTLGKVFERQGSIERLQRADRRRPSQEEEPE